MSVKAAGYINKMEGNFYQMELGAHKIQGIDAGIFSGAAFARNK